MFRTLGAMRAPFAADPKLDQEMCGGRVQAILSEQSRREAGVQFT
jgi:hypothetical protein